MWDTLIQLFPDSGGYFYYAGLIQDGTNWFHETSLSSYRDITHHRLPTYPALIALGRSLFGPLAGLVFVILCQLGLFIFALQRFFNLLRDLNFSRLLTWFAVFTLATGIPLFYAFSILTDSIFASLGILALISTTRCFLGIDTKFDKIMLAVSLLFMTLFRESTPYFALTLLPFLFFVLYKKQYKKILIMAALIYLPTLTATAGLMSWNKYRTGEAFVTTGLSTALISPLLDLKNQFPATAYKTPLDVYLPAKEELTFADGLSAATHLSLEQRIGPLEIEKRLKKSFFESWIDFPLQRSFIMLMNTRPHQLTYIFNPFYTAREFIEHKNKAPLPRIYELSKINFETQNGILLFCFILGLTLFRILSLVLIAYGLYKLYQRLKSPEKQLIDWAYLGLAIQAFAWWGIMSMVHLEPRYMMTSYAVFIVLALASLQNKIVKDD